MTHGAGAPGEGALGWKRRGRSWGVGVSVVRSDSFTPDGLPLAGRLRDLSDLYLLAGFNGQGKGWAPALASRLAEELVTGHGSVPACFAADRFKAGGTDVPEGASG